MDLQDVIALTCALIDIDSTTGRESELANWLVARLREHGYNVLEQPVDGCRQNRFARLEPPDVVFSTHLDCVPPFIPRRRHSHSRPTSPFLSGWGTPLLFRPGSAMVAHTADERVEVEALRCAVGAYVRLAQRLLQSA